MKIRFYGKLGDQLGAEVEIDPPVGTYTVAHLRSVLAEIFPDASIDLRQRSLACVGDAIVREDRELTEADLVEFFPPLSGG